MDEFLIDKRQVRRAFSQAAAQYDAAAVLQREVCERMLEKLDCIRLQPARILDAGCGTGRGTRQLAQRYAGTDIVALDMALGMLGMAREQGSWWRKLLSGSKQVQVCADVEALPLASDCVDMVWSSLTLQWCNDLAGTLRGLHQVLRKDGLLMFSTFGPDTLHELRSAFRGVDGHSHVNRFIDMHDIGDMLVAAGFADPVMEMERFTLTYADVKSVMQDLRSIGAHNVTAGRAQGMMGKAAWRCMAENYERFRRDGKLPATFEIIYGHAWKPEAKVTADGAQVIRTPFRL